MVSHEWAAHRPKSAGLELSQSGDGAGFPRPPAMMMTSFRDGLLLQAAEDRQDPRTRPRSSTIACGEFVHAATAPVAGHFYRNPNLLFAVSSAEIFQLGRVPGKGPPMTLEARSFLCHLRHHREGGVHHSTNNGKFNPLGINCLQSPRHGWPEQQHFFNLNITQYSPNHRTQRSALRHCIVALQYAPNDQFPIAFEICLGCSIDSNIQTCLTANPFFFVSGPMPPFATVFWGLSGLEPNMGQPQDEGRRG